MMQISQEQICQTKNEFFDDENTNNGIAVFDSGNLPIIHRHMMQFKAQKKNHVCKYCKKHFKLKGGLKEHINSVHLKIKPEVCSICNVGYGHKSSLRHHMIAKHPHAWKYPCRFCSEIYNNKFNLINHENSVHLAKNSKCPVCGKTLAKNYTLARHIVSLHTSFAAQLLGNKLIEFKKSGEDVLDKITPDLKQQEETVLKILKAYAKAQDVAKNSPINHLASADTCNDNESIENGDTENNSTATIIITSSSPSVSSPPAVVASSPVYIDEKSSFKSLCPQNFTPMSNITSPSRSFLSSAACVDEKSSYRSLCPKDYAPNLVLPPSTSDSISSANSMTVNDASCGGKANASIKNNSTDVLISSPAKNLPILTAKNYNDLIEKLLKQNIPFIAAPKKATVIATTSTSPSKTPSTPSILLSSSQAALKDVSSLKNLSSSLPNCNNIKREPVESLQTFTSSCSSVVTSCDNKSDVDTFINSNVITTKVKQEVDMPNSFHSKPATIHDETNQEAISLLLKRQALDGKNNGVNKKCLLSYDSFVKSPQSQIHPLLPKQQAINGYLINCESYTPTNNNNSAVGLAPSLSFAVKGNNTLSTESSKPSNNKVPNDIDSLKLLTSLVDSIGTQKAKSSSAVSDSSVKGGENDFQNSSPLLSLSLLGRAPPNYHAPNDASSSIKVTESANTKPNLGGTGDNISSITSSSSPYSFPLTLKSLTNNSPSLIITTSSSPSFSTTLSNSSPGTSTTTTTPSKVTCNFCPKIFPSKVLLKKHIKAQHLLETKLLMSCYSSLAGKNGNGATSIIIGPQSTVPTSSSSLTPQSSSKNGNNPFNSPPLTLMMKPNAVPYLPSSNAMSNNTTPKLSSATESCSVSYAPTASPLTDEYMDVNSAIEMEVYKNQCRELRDYFNEFKKILPEDVIEQNGRDIDADSDGSVGSLGYFIEKPATAYDQVSLTSENSEGEYHCPKAKSSNDSNLLTELFNAFPAKKDDVKGEGINEEKLRFIAQNIHEIQNRSDAEQKAIISSILQASSGLIKPSVSADTTDEESSSLVPTSCAVNQIVKEKNKNEKMAKTDFNCTMCTQSFLDKFLLFNHININHSFDSNHKHRKTSSAQIFLPDPSSFVSQTHQANSSFNKIPLSLFAGNISPHTPSPPSVVSVAHSAPTKWHADTPPPTPVNSESVFPCTNCDKIFSKKCSLVDHNNAVHHSLRPFDCNFCSKSFKYRAARSAHMRSVHNSLSSSAFPISVLAASLKYQTSSHFSDPNDKQPPQILH